MPTFPAFVTMKFVAVEEPMTKEGPVMPFGFTESCAHGVEVPRPRRLFALSQKKVPLPAFAAWVSFVPSEKMTPPA